MAVSVPFGHDFASATAKLGILELAEVVTAAKAVVPDSCQVSVEMQSSTSGPEET